MTLLKLPRIEVPLDAFVAYITDANPLLVEHKAYFAASHPDGDAFADIIVQAGTNVLALSAKAAREGHEAVVATEAQNTVVANTRALLNDIRKQGGFIIHELELRGDTASLMKAREVRVGCGIGSRISVSSQTGLRRLLAVQLAGFDLVHETFAEFKQADPRPKLRAAEVALDEAIAAQAKEQMEADIQQDHLEDAVDKAVHAVRRAVQLLNARDDVPMPLRRGLLTLEGQHRKVFYTSSTPSKDEPADVDAIADVLEPA